MATKMCLTLALAFTADARRANIDDEKLVLVGGSGAKYVVEAQTYCLGFGWEPGSLVLSTEDLDFCTTSMLISKASKNTCAVWCP